MKETSYAGIDYSGPGSTVNRDAETGIRYGVISQNSVSGYAMDDVFSNGEDEGFLSAKKDLVESLKNAILLAVEDYGSLSEDSAEDMAGEIINSDDFQWADSDESGPYSYESDGVSVQTTSNNDLWVFKSPLYTKAQFCSPCVPGAGNLNTYCENGPKTYCLPADWFEDGKAPYSIWSVETDELIYKHVTE